MNWLHEFVAFIARTFVIGSQLLIKQCWDLRCYQEGCFPAQFNPQRRNNLGKFLSVRLHQCFGPVNTLSAQGCPKTYASRHLGNKIFRSQYYGIYLSYEKCIIGSSGVLIQIPFLNIKIKEYLQIFKNLAQFFAYFFFKY